MNKKYKLISSIIISLSLCLNTAFAGTYTITTKDQLFNALSQDARNFDATGRFTFKGISSTTATSWLKEANMKLGEFGNLTRGWSGNYGFVGSDLIYNLTYNYNITKEQYDYVVSYAKQVLPNIINDQMDVFQKEKTIHDWIIQNVDYDYTYTSYDAYKAITTGKTVCNGYAMLANIMFNEAGVPSMVVVGTANNGVKTEGHAWNIVNLNGNWYHVDLTWDDLGNGNVRYEYYNLRTEEIKKNHFPTSIFPTTSTKTFADLLKETYGDDTTKYLGLYGTQILDKVNSFDELAINIKQALDENKTSLKFAYKGSLSSTNINLLKAYVPQINNMGYYQSSLVRLNGTGYNVINVNGLSKKDVIPTNIIALKFLKTSIEVRKNQSCDLKQILNVYPLGLNNPNLIWASSNTKVVTIENGVVTAIAPGTATIKVLDATNSKLYAQITIKVPVDLLGISSSVNEAYVKIGATYTPIITFNPTNATYKKVTYSTDNENVLAIVNGKPVAKGLGVANLTITSVEGGYATTIKVNVIQTPLTSLALNKTSTTLSVGISESLSLTYNPTNASVKDVTWSSSNTAVATIDQNGKITANAKGTATIKVVSKQNSSIYKTCTVYVK